jgi:hypothetical protein
LKFRKIKKSIATASVLPLMQVSGLACGGGYFPDCYLCLGDAPMLWAPTANFANEIARMKLPKMPFVFKESDTWGPEQTAETDVAELRAALMKSAATNREEILDTYEAGRQKILRYQEEFQLLKTSYSTRLLPAEAEAEMPALEEIEIPEGLPKEFSLYLTATIAWHLDEVEIAREGWEDILHLPKEQRTYRTIWASFMLGKSWLDEEPERAIKYFQKVRELAKEGWRDSLGLAASSYGWEGRAELNRTNYTAALDRYIEALRAGDPTAAQSLQWTVSKVIQSLDSLVELAANPVARRIITAHLISRFQEWGTSAQFDNPAEFAPGEMKSQPQDLWLKAIEKANVKDLELAEQLALAFYQAGKMKKAQRWLLRAPAKSLVVQWLQAKLLLRSGQTARAATLLAKIARCFPLQTDFEGPPPTLFQNLRMEGLHPSSGIPSLESQVLAEFAILQITRREYIEALDILLRHGFERDAAYVAERILTLEELKGYVDRNFPKEIPQPAEPEGEDKERGEAWDNYWRTQALCYPSFLIRRQLGCRLMRAFHFEEAAPYFFDKESDLKEFVSYWDTGYDTEQPKDERAKAFWAAANLMQTRGDTLFGSVIEPFWKLWDDFDHFEDSPLTRMTNAQIKLVPPSSDEIRRAISHAPEKRRRFNYHYWAADLAWNAAQLMPNNSDETARVLHAAGSWIKYLDQHEADRFYKALVRRCRKTEVGDAADKKRWFPLLDEGGRIVYPLRVPIAMADDAPEAADVDVDTARVPAEEVQ